MASGRNAERIAAPHLNQLKTLGIAPVTTEIVLTSEQLELDLTVEKEVEIDGIGMGVLSDGTPYLTGRGLARMCGIDQKAVVQVTSAWSSRELQPRVAKIREILRQQNYPDTRPYIPINKDGSTHHAFPDAVCMAFLEYYAFEAGANCKLQAQKNYRLLARKSFRDFIYAKVGYSPADATLRTWKYFHDRVALVHDNVPIGYFCIFKEIADIMVTLIKAGGEVGAHFIPDISVGLHWGNHWRKNGLADKYGTRQTYTHNYPEYFPQAASNPQKPFCYPDAALPEFRQWVRLEYLQKKFPTYLMDKHKDGAISLPSARKVLAVIEAAKPHRRIR